MIPWARPGRRHCSGCKKGEEGDNLVAGECYGCWQVWDGEIITIRFAFSDTRGWWVVERKHRHSSIPFSVHLRGLEMWSYGQNAAESRSAVAVGPRPSILTSITQALLPGMVDRLFLGRSYFQSDILEWIRPRRALMWCVWFFLRGGVLGVCIWVGFLSVGCIKGPLHGRLLTSEVWSVCACRRVFARRVWLSKIWTGTLGLLWADPLALRRDIMSGRRSEERRPPCLQGLMKDNIGLILWLWKTTKGTLFLMTAVTGSFITNI